MMNEKLSRWVRQLTDRFEEVCGSAGMSFSWRETKDVVAYPGGQFVNHLLVFTVRGLDEVLTENIMVTLFAENPHAAARDLNRKFQQLHLVFDLPPIDYRDAPPVPETKPSPVGEVADAAKRLYHVVGEDKEHPLGTVYTDDPRGTFVKVNVNLGAMFSAPRWLMTS